ncbi:MAG: phytanoyl-CoA dioxygenase family protein [Dehalococcoidia bacterium]|nr:phytanoyl-CoA dioxygenase family protein [Dehalococcoidia bacterium]
MAFMLLTETRAAEQLREEGYTVLRGVLDVEQDIEPLIEEYGVVLDGLIEKLYAEGKLRHKYPAENTLDRLSAFVADTGDEFFDHLSIYVSHSYDSADRPMYLHPQMFNLLRSPRLLDAIEQFIGDEIAVSPLHITRIKPPEHSLSEVVQNSPNGMISKTLWHQDLWAFQTDADETDALTVWVPMVPVDEETGCLLVVPGSHRSGELSVHCKPTENRPHFKGIPDEIIPEEQVTLPADPGDLVILNKLTQHSSLVNVSDRVRWSYDLRYQPIGQPVGQGGRPAWIARSRKHPEREMTGFEDWRTMWRDIMAREASQGGIEDHTRYSLTSPLCF